jgi:hypothetical protein
MALDPSGQVWNRKYIEKYNRKEKSEMPEAFFFTPDKGRN